MRFRWTRFRISTLLGLITLVACYLGIVIAPERQRTQVYAHLSEVVEVWGNSSAPVRSYWQIIRPKLVIGIDTVPWGDAGHVSFAPGSEKQFVLCARLQDVGQVTACALAISDDDLLPFREKPIRELTLSLTDVTDASLDTFARMPVLSVLDVGGTGITKDAMDQFRLDHPSIRIEHSYWQKDWRVAARQLTVAGNFVFPGSNWDATEVLIYEHSSMSFANMRLALSRLEPLQVELMADEMFVKSVVDLPNLVSLDVEYFFHVADPKGRIDWTNASKNLREVRINTTSQDMIRMLESLNPQVQLQRVDFILGPKHATPSQMGVSEVAARLAQHKTLRSICLCGFDKIDASSIRPLSALPNLQRLEFSDCSLADDAFSELGALPNMKFLAFEQVGANWEHLQGLTTSKTLQVIHWWNFPGFRQLMESLHPMPELRVLSFIPDEPGDYSIEAFAKIREVWDEVATASDEELLKLAKQNQPKYEYFKLLQRFRRASPDCEFRNLPALEEAIAESQ